MKPITKGYKTHLNLPVPIPDEEKKNWVKCLFSLFFAVPQKVLQRP